MSDKTALWIDLRQSISAPRLKPYILSNDTDELDALARYYWNIALSEALYPALQCFEITLRNTMHHALSKGKGTQFWFDDAWLLLPKEQANILEAKRELDLHGKAHEPGRIIAELKFGFWTSLFAGPYERSLLLPILPATFKNMPRKLRTRRVLAKRVNDIRKLRNRVFHHEPIWNMPNLLMRYQEVVEAIGWMNPRMQQYMSIIDRFEQIFQEGWSPLRYALEYRLLEEAEARQVGENTT